jgi:hypothetical protein
MTLISGWFFLKIIALFSILIALKRDDLNFYGALMQSTLVKIHEDLRFKTNNSLVRVNIELFDSSGFLRSHLLSDMGSNFHTDFVFDYKSNLSKACFDFNAYASLGDDEYTRIQIISATLHW